MKNSGKNKDIHLSIRKKDDQDEDGDKFILKDYKIKRKEKQQQQQQQQEQQQQILLPFAQPQSQPQFQMLPPTKTQPSALELEQAALLFNPFLATFHPLNRLFIPQNTLKQDCSMIPQAIIPTFIEKPPVIESTTIEIPPTICPEEKENHPPFQEHKKPLNLKDPRIRRKYSILCIEDNVEDSKQIKQPIESTNICNPQVELPIPLVQVSDQSNTIWKEDRQVTRNTPLENSLSNQQITQQLEKYFETQQLIKSKSEKENISSEQIERKEDSLPKKVKSKCKFSDKISDEEGQSDEKVKKRKHIQKIQFSISPKRKKFPNSKYQYNYNYNSQKPYKFVPYPRQSPPNRKFKNDQFSKLEPIRLRKKITSKFSSSPPSQEEINKLISIPQQNNDDKQQCNSTLEPSIQECKAIQQDNQLIVQEQEEKNNQLESIIIEQDPVEEEIEKQNSMKNLIDYFKYSSLVKNLKYYRIVFQRIFIVSLYQIHQQTHNSQKNAVQMKIHTEINGHSHHPRAQRIPIIPILQTFTLSQKDPRKSSQLQKNSNKFN